VSAVRLTPLTVTVLVVGGVMFGLGVSLLALDRAAPTISALGLRWAVAASVLVGGGLLTGGIGFGLLGWARSDADPMVSPGSHRAILGTTALGVIASLALAIAASAAIPGTTGRSTAGFLLLALSVDVALIGLCFMQGIRTGIVSRVSLGLSWDRLGTGLDWGLRGALLLFMLSLANGLILRLLGVESPQAEAMRFIRDLPRPQFILVLLAAAVAAPVSEELFFRGYVFRAYLQEKGPAVAFLGSAVIFAALHGQVILLFAIASMGLVLAWLYQRSGTIVAPILAHAINNGVAFLAQLALPPT
jgi:uncharacterized protein